MEPSIPADAAETAASDAWSDQSLTVPHNPGPCCTLLLLLLHLYTPCKNCEPSPRSRRQKRESWQPATATSNEDRGEEQRYYRYIHQTTRKQTLIDIHTHVVVQVHALHGYRIMLWISSANVTGRAVMLVAGWMDWIWGGGVVQCNAAIIAEICSCLHSMQHPKKCCAMYGRSYRKGRPMRRRPARCPTALYTVHSSRLLRLC
uniref:Uncharacterized protein n=1 Tax=Oryza punctata TaxID=4537 RepID=A0A0E0KQ51_ORYPU